MATMTAANPAEESDTTTIARRIAGMAIRPSITRMTMPSSQRMYPASRPMTSPNATLMTATDAPTSREARAPYATRL